MPRGTLRHLKCGNAGNAILLAQLAGWTFLFTPSFLSFIAKIHFHYLPESPFTTGVARAQQGQDGRKATRPSPSLPPSVAARAAAAPDFQVRCRLLIPV